MFLSDSLPGLETENGQSYSSYGLFVFLSSNTIAQKGCRIYPLQTTIFTQSTYLFLVCS